MIKALGLVAAFVLAASSAHAHSHKLKQLEIVHPWCIETGDTAKPVLVSMIIKNAGSKPDRLLRAAVSNAAKTELRAGIPPDAEGEVIAAIPLGSLSEVNLK